MGRSQILDEEADKIGVEAGVAHGADLLPVGEDGDHCVSGVLDLQGRPHRGVGANLVIVAICANHAAVKADITGAERGDHSQVGGEEVLLHNAVLLMEQIEDVQLHLLADLVVFERQGAHQHVELLPFDAVFEGAGVLVLAQMGKQVGDTEHRLLLVVADLHRDCLPIF